eukprot:3689587-Prymnesium_polylepis.1
MRLAAPSTALLAAPPLPRAGAQQVVARAIRFRGLRRRRRVARHARGRDAVGAGPARRQRQHPAQLQLRRAVASWRGHDAGAVWRRGRTRGPADAGARRVL